MCVNKILKVSKGIFSAVLCIVLLFSLFETEVFAEDNQTVILAIGDSISTGYGLSEPENQSFVYGILGEGGKVVNMAVNGNTTSGILSQLNDEQNEKRITKDNIKEADVVTITCGGNDMMAVLYGCIADEWNKSNPDDKITADEVLERISEMNLGMLFSVVNLLNPESESYVINSETFEEALSEYAKNLKEITNYINTVDPSVAIIVSTQYNPYVEFKGTKFDIIYKGFEDGVVKLNNVINENSLEGGYTVTDSKKLFDDREGLGDYYNADEETTNLDFHPNAEGHKLLSESFKTTLLEIEYVEITMSIYLEELDGTFQDEATESKKYNVVRGKKISIPTLNVTGFTINKNAEGTLISAVAEDGVVLKIYYTRNTYKLGWHTYEKVTFDEYKYGQPITAPTVKRKGYKFVSWDEEVPETMPAKDVTYVAVWSKKRINFLGIITVLLSVTTVSVGVWVYIKDKKNKAKKGKSN